MLDLLCNMTFFRKLGICLATATVLILSGCASVQENTNPSAINSEWLAPDATFEQKTISGVLVVSLTDSSTNRRIFEDIVSNVFAFRGIPATPSYQFIGTPQDLVLQNGAANLPRLQAAAKKAKASDILIVRSMGVKTQQIYNPGVTWGRVSVLGDQVLSGRDHSSVRDLSGETCGLFLLQSRPFTSQKVP